MKNQTLVLLLLITPFIQNCSMTELGAPKGPGAQAALNALSSNADDEFGNVNQNGNENDLVIPGTAGLPGIPGVPGIPGIPTSPTIPSPNPTPAYNCPETEVSERFQAAYKLAGRADGYASWGIYFFTYKNYQTYVGCEQNSGGLQPGQFGNVCLADCTYKVTYDCEGKVKKMIHDSGNGTACHSAVYPSVTTGNFAAQPVCTSTHKDYAGWSCK